MSTKENTLTLKNIETIYKAMSAIEENDRSLYFNQYFVEIQKRLFETIEWNFHLNENEDELRNNFSKYKDAPIYIHFVNDLMERRTSMKNILENAQP